MSYVEKNQMERRKFYLRKFKDLREQLKINEL